MKTLYLTLVAVIGVSYSVQSASLQDAKSPCQSDIKKFCTEVKDIEKLKDCLQKKRLKLTKACVQELDAALLATAVEPDCEDGAEAKTAAKKVEKKPAVEVEEDCEVEMIFEEVKVEQ